VAAFQKQVIFLCAEQAHAEKQKRNSHRSILCHK
jgi:hypothetical protein